MKIAITALTVAASGFISASLQADIPEKYQTIVDRNSFGLNPPPKPPDPSEIAPVPPANVKLTGFATINGQKKAYFTIPGKAPNEAQQYVGLAEGERDGVLEIVSIADSEGEVRIRNSGVEMVLSLKNNGFKPATIAPGVVVAPNTGIPPTPGAVAGAPSPVYNPSAPSPVVSDYAKSVQPNPNGGNPQPPEGQPNGTPEGMRSIPTRTLRLNPQNPGSPQSSVQPENSGAQSVVYSPSSSSSVVANSSPVKNYASLGNTGNAASSVTTIGGHNTFSGNNSSHFSNPSSGNQNPIVFSGYQPNPVVAINPPRVQVDPVVQYVQTKINEEINHNPNTAPINILTGKPIQFPPALP